MTSPPIPTPTPIPIARVRADTKCAEGYLIFIKNNPGFIAERANTLQTESKFHGSFEKGMKLNQVPLYIFEKPCLDEGLIRHIPFSGLNLDTLQQSFGQP